MDLSIVPVSVSVMFVRMWSIIEREQILLCVVPCIVATIRFLLHRRVGEGRYPLPFVEVRAFVLIKTFYWILRPGW